MVDQSDDIAKLNEYVRELIQLNDGMTKLLAAIVVENGGSIDISKATIVNLPPGLDLDSVDDVLENKLTIKVRNYE